MLQKVNAETQIPYCNLTLSSNLATRDSSRSKAFLALHSLLDWFLIANNSYLADYKDDEAYTLACKSYGGSNAVFLTPENDGTGAGSSSGSNGSSQGSGASGASGSNGSNGTKYTLSLAASPTAGGSVSGGGQYNAGQSVQISATANSGYTFTRWSDGVTTSSRTVTMDANKTLSAIFTANGTTPDPTEGDGEENNLH